MKDDDGGFYPSQITYGGYTVEFIYNSAERNDTQKKFFSNVNYTGYSKITKILNVIKFNCGNETVHSYYLTYLYQGELPKRELVYIQKYGTNNETEGKPSPDNRTASCQFVWRNSAGTLQVDKTCSDINLLSDNMGQQCYQDKVFQARFPHWAKSGLSDIVVLLRKDTNPFYKMVPICNSSTNNATNTTHLYRLDVITETATVNDFIKDKPYCDLFAPVDVDGDGYNEILYIFHDQYSRYHARLITYNEATSKFEISDNDIFSIPDINSGDGRYEFFVGDFDGNGCSDLLLTNEIFTRIYLSVDGAFNQQVNNPASQNLYLNSSSHKIYVGDFSGDGRDQLISMNENKINSSCSYCAKIVSVKLINGVMSMQISESSPEFLKHLFVDDFKSVHFCQGDFNGDNKDDFVAIMGKAEDRNWYFYLSKGDGNNFEKLIWNNSNNYDEIAEQFVPISADFNGDGFTDLSMTKMTTSYYPPGQLNGFDYDFYYRYDYLIRADDSGVKVLRKCILDENQEEQHVGRVLHNSTGINRENGVLPCVGNFRGTSPCEVAYVRLYNGATYDDNINAGHALRLRLWNTSDFDNSPLTSIICARNGLGASTWFEYIQHTYQGVWNLSTGQKDQPVNYTKIYTSHLNVVKTMKVETDEGHVRNIKFYFRNPIMHTRGKGFLGFLGTRKIEECQGGGTIVTFKSFKLHDKYYVLYPDNTMMSKGSTQISLSEYSYDFKKLNVAYSMPDKVFLLVLTGEVNTNSLNGTTTRTTFSNFDNYGNPKRVDLSVTTNNPSTETYNKISTYIYDNITTSGCRLIGLIKSCTDIYYMGSGSEVTISTTYDYDNVGFMTRRVSNGVEERFSRDNNGNTTRIERVANGNMRIETMTYSGGGRFLESYTDAMGNTTNYQYINRNGLLRKKIDPNGLAMTYHYDMLGNVTSVEYPDGTREIIVRRWTQAPNGNSSNNHPDMPTTDFPVYYTWSKRNGQPEVTSFYDQHDRLLRTVTKDFNDSKIFRDYSYYNKSGMLKTESLPYFGDDGHPAGLLSYSYDDFNRVTSISKPGSEMYQHSYKGNTEVIIDFDGRKKQVVYLPNGLPYKVTDNDMTTIEYSYFGDGNIKSTKIVGNDKTKIEYIYDANRHLLSMSDPSLGMRTYSYNAFGELLSETNANMHVTAYSYDALGRMTSRTDDDGTTTWHYDQQMFGFLDNTVYEPVNSDEPVVIESFEYDGLGRIVRQEQSFNDEEQPLEFTYIYNKYGHKSRVTYPSGYTLSCRYDINGTMLSVNDFSDGAVLWSVKSTNNFGNITEFALGSDISVVSTYDALTGLVKNTTAENRGVIQDVHYKWDTKGNLAGRTDEVTCHTEVFSYDKFNRLTKIETDKLEGDRISYDNLGNIDCKYDAGAMIYNSSNPYAVRKIIDSPNIGLFEDAQDVKYTSFDKIRFILQGTNTLDVSYGADRQRVWQVLNVGNSEKTKRYFTTLYEEVSESEKLKKIHYLTSSTGLFAIFATDSDNDTTMSYILKDHQGSLYAAVTDNDVERYSFDAWGRRRNPQTLSYDNVTTSFDRGYTMHEHYDCFGLINMNGRLYDPLVGRMLSPDIVIQDPEHSQSYNRYSYCFNNPLRFTDPSGYVVTVPPEFEKFYMPQYFTDFNTYKEQLEELGAKNVAFNTDEAEGMQTTTITWQIYDNDYQMTIVDHGLRDYSQYCQNSCVADAFAAQEARLNGNKDLTPETIMSWKQNSCEEGLVASDIIPIFFNQSIVYLNIIDYSDINLSKGINHYEKRAYIEMNRNSCIFFDFYNNYTNGHIVNATTATCFSLNKVVLDYEVGIWDSGLNADGKVEGFKSMMFYDLNKLKGKFGVFHKK